MTPSDLSTPTTTLDTATPRKTRLPGLRLALLSGVLLWLANPVPAVWPLAWIALAPLIVSVTQAKRLRQAVWRGYLFGWVFLGSVWYWVGLTIAAWTHSPIGWAGWFGLTLILASFYGMWGGLAWWLNRRGLSPGMQIIALSCAWVVIEYLRTRGTLTMPWSQLSYTQYRFLPILQIADITGAYGVSWIMLCVNGALAHWWTHRGTTEGVRYLYATLTLTVMLCVYGWARMLPPDAGKPLPVAAIQAGFNSLPSGFNPAPPPSPLEQQATFTTLTAQAANANPRPSLYVWPESAAPGDAVHDGSVLTFLTYLARDHQAAVLTGSTLRDRVTLKQGDAGPEQTLQTTVNENASVLFDAQGSRPRYYVKRQLVPFGEFVPFRDLIPQAVSRQFGFADMDDVTGKSAETLSYVDARYGTVALGPFICYEAMFPPYAREMTQRGATLLVTQSNDSWFQSRAAMEQHLAAVVLRAIENRRQTVRSTTTGITCFLDSRGRVLDALPLNRAGYVVHTVQLLTGKTIYTRLGDWFVLLCVVTLIGLAYKGRRTREAGSGSDTE